MALTGATALAGSFTSDFSNPNQSGFTLLSNDATRPNGDIFAPVIEDGHLVLAYNEINEQGAILLDDFDGGQTIESFTAKFKLQIGPGSGNAADGTAFCFGPDVATGATFSEEGIGNGIIVSFDIYDNGAAEAPAVDVKYAGATIGHTAFAKADMVTGKMEDVVIQLKRNGTLNVAYKGQILYTNLVLPGFVPTAGQFVIGSRCGGESAAQWLDDLNVQTVIAGAAVMPTVTTQPQSQTIPEGADVTFGIGFDGTAPISFQWYKNSTAIDGATNTTVTLTKVSYTDNNAKLKCEVTNDAGTKASQEATLTVTQDKTAPTLVSAKGSTDFLGVVVSFSEPVSEATGADKNNYSIAGLTISAAAVVGDGTKVALTTSQQAEGFPYTLVVNNIKDRAVTPNTIAANSQVSFRTFVFALGSVLHKKYINVDDGTGASPDNLFNDARFPNAPDRVDIEPMWEYPAGGAGRVAADPLRNYFDTIEGYFIPATTGDYVFFTCGADRWWLYLSTDADPANKYMVAAEPGGWTNARDWNTGQGGTDMSRSRSDQSTFNVWPDAPTIHLTAGKRYYMLSVHHDPSWCGADDFAATFKLESEADPLNGDAPRLAGNLVGTYLDPNGSSVTISEQPADITVQQGLGATFTVAATGTSVYGGTVTYQWQKQAQGAATWTDIAGATLASYTTPATSLADSGTKYRAICKVPAINEPSASATLTVVADTFAPKLAGVGSIIRNGVLEIGVGFDENVDPATAGTTGNYTLSKGTITGIRYAKYDHAEASGIKLGTAGPFYGAAVVLTTSGLTGGDNVTLTVKNIKDTLGNAMSAAGESKAFKVTSKMKYAFVGGDDYLQGELNGMNINPDPALWVDDVVALSDKDFDLIGSGTSNWGNYDELTLAYEEVTGDFDKVVRVEFQDPTSQWSRAGLCATSGADEGKSRADVTAGYAMSKRFLLRVNTAIMWNGVPGNNMNECYCRPSDGGVYADTGASAGSPAYPNAWLRMSRKGQLFTAYYSANGVDWTSYYSYTYVAPNTMPNTVLVGPYYCPELNNNGAGEGIGHSAVGKFRDYGDFSVSKPPGKMTITTGGTGLAVTWEGDGTLQSAAAVTGPWTDVGTAKPYNTSATGSAVYYRVKGK